MDKKLILVLSIFIFFFGFKFADAEVIINEIAWKGTTGGSTYEWLELANSGSTEDISGWTIKDETSQLNITIPAGVSISNGGFYVIKRTTSDITPYDFSTAFNGGLNDAGEKLILSDSGGTPKQTLDFSSGWPDENMTSENTMQWNGSSWITASPTPKAQNEDSGSGGDEGDGDDEENTEEDDSSDTSDDSSDSDSETKATATPTIKAKILADPSAFAGQPVEFLVDVKYGSLTYATGKCFWNFGDGTSMEGNVGFQKFTHIYYYPGEYKVLLEYYRSNGSLTVDASDEVVIKVVPTTVLISKVGDAKDFFVELSNNSNYEIDISKWRLEANGKIFAFPRNTVIMSKKQITVSSRLTGFVLGDEKNLKLISSTGEVVHNYGISSTSAENMVKVLYQAPIKAGIEDKDTENSPETKSEIPPETKISAEDLSASAINSGIETKNNVNNYLFIGGLVFFLIISCGAVYFLRKSKNPANMTSGDDFHIIDE